MSSGDIEAVFTTSGCIIKESVSNTIVLGHAMSGSIAGVIRQFLDWIVSISLNHLLLPEAFHLRYNLPNVSFFHHSLKSSDFILLLLDVVEHPIQLLLVVWKAWRFNNRSDLIVVG